MWLLRWGLCSLVPLPSFLNKKPSFYEAETAKSMGAEVRDLRPDSESQTEHKLAVWPEVNDTPSLRPVYLSVN